jgi:hypothetical protein
VKRRRLPLALLFSLVFVFVVVAVASCGVPGQTEPTQLANDNVRAATPTTRFPPGTAVRRIEMCFVSGDHLIAILVPLPSPLTVPRTLEALVKASRSRLPAGAESTVNNPKLLTARTTMRGIAQLDFSADFARISRREQVLTVAQVVCTLTSMPGIGQVLFTAVGQPIDIPRANGSVTRSPVSRADYATLLPAS